MTGYGTGRRHRPKTAGEAKPDRQDERKPRTSTSRRRGPGLIGLNETTPYREPPQETPEEEPDEGHDEENEDEGQPTEEVDPFDHGPKRLRLNPLWLWDGENLCWSCRRLPRQRPLDWETFRQALERLLKCLPQVDPLFLDLDTLTGFLQTSWLAAVTGSSGTIRLEGEALMDLEGRVFPLARLIAAQGSAEEDWPGTMKKIWLAETIGLRLGPDALASLSWAKIKHWLPETIEKFCGDLNRAVREAFTLDEDLICFRAPKPSTLQRRWLPAIKGTSPSKEGSS